MNHITNFNPNTLGSWEAYWTQPTLEPETSSRPNITDIDYWGNWNEESTTALTNHLFQKEITRNGPAPLGEEIIDIENDEEWKTIQPKHKSKRIPLSIHAQERAAERKVTRADIQKAILDGKVEDVSTIHGPGKKYSTDHTVVVTGNYFDSPQIITVWNTTSQSVAQKKEKAEKNTKKSKIQKVQALIEKSITHARSVMSVNPHLDLKFWEETPAHANDNETILDNAGRLSFVFNDVQISIPYFTCDPLTGNTLEAFGDDPVLETNFYSLVVPEIGRIWLPLEKVVLQENGSVNPSN